MAEHVTTSGNTVSTPPRTSPAERQLPAPPTERLLPPPKGSEHPPEKHHALLWILALVIIAALVALPFLLRKKTPVRQAPPTAVSTTNAARGDIDVTVWALGTVTPVYTANVSPRVDGQLIKVAYTEGQMVTNNQLLAEIDPTPYQAAVVQGEGQLARDKALLEGAKVDLGRYQTAFKKNAVPKQQVDDELALVHQDEGTVKIDEGTVSNAEVNLGYCFVRAPFTGRAGLRMVDPGNVVHSANTNALVVIAQLQPITVVFNPSEDYLPEMERQLQAGHQMVVEAWDRDQKQILAKGTFYATGAQIDTSTGTIAIKAMFDNKDLLLFPNQFVNAKLIVETLTNVTLIPTAAIQRNPQGAFVYVITNREATVTNTTNQVVSTVTNTFVAMHTITTGVTDNDTTSVQGLEPGELIATDNFNKLEDGAKVTLRQKGAKGQKGGGGAGAPGDKKRHRDKAKAQEDQS
ncbi:MAG TPA: efflux RND transporter periplasmic adaptor subunit [Verrucomicrobiae bacterium]|jgi:multidrug efflux system membrane fusion protein|nr:efflux RND transporter periplasmic adaptor subunit [Verrucomicrobiae bacterium]